jgi:mannose-6-phosphate isomerase-like protein (cupin superfamily)
VSAEIIDIAAVARDVARPWEPRDLARANDTTIRLAKLEGEFPWHTHEEGQLFVVPRGARHRPVATAPAVTLLIEKPETLQYGDQTR